jgi:Leucine-rich repeat (LRR) protein
MVNGESEPPIAELVFESDKWVIIITHDKESNYIFGKNTTWCTAGTRYNTMFDNYNKQGPLFVLIKKGFGSRKAIQTDPSVRMQFHFETNQFMNAEDKPIKISEFLLNNKEIKEFFRSYVIKTVKKKSLSNTKFSTESIIDLLSKLGYVDELIPILRDAKAEVLNLKETALDKNVLMNIGEIKTLKTLIISDCGLTELPDGLRNLTDLVNLDISKNKKITSVPSFVNELVNLESLDMSWCDIHNDFDISNLTKLKFLVLDSNPNLNSLPKGFHNCKNLKRISASCCNLSEIPDIILTLSELYMLDFHKNENLSDVPETLTAMEKIIAVNLDKCNYPNKLHQILTKNAKAKVKKCSYVHYIEN